MYHTYDRDDYDVVKEIITNAVKDLIEFDSILLEKDQIASSYSIMPDEEVIDRKIHELAINHRFARYLENRLVARGFVEYSVDIEYNRFINNKKKVFSLETEEHIVVRPDILVHKRIKLDAPVPHLLVVEAKKLSIIDKDRNHVKYLMHDSNYQYKYGLLVSYLENFEEIRLNLLTLNNGEFSEDRFGVPR